MLSELCSTAIVPGALGEPQWPPAFSSFGTVAKPLAAAMESVGSRESEGSPDFRQRPTYPFPPAREPTLGEAQIEQDAGSTGSGSGRSENAALW